MPILEQTVPVLTGVVAEAVDGLAAQGRVQRLYVRVDDEQRPVLIGYVRPDPLEVRLDPLESRYRAVTMQAETSMSRERMSECEGALGRAAADLGTSRDLVLASGPTLEDAYAAGMTAFSRAGSDRSWSLYGSYVLTDMADLRDGVHAGSSDYLAIPPAWVPDEALVGVAGSLNAERLTELRRLAALGAPRISDKRLRVQARQAALKAAGEDAYVYTDVWAYDDVRAEINKMGRTLAEYVADNGVGTVCFLDRAARPSYIAFVEHWRHLYPERDLPAIRFLSPKGFMAREDLAEGVIKAGRTRLRDDKQEEIESLDNMRSRADIVSEVREAMTRLGPRATARVLLFDTCAHDGETLNAMLGKFRDAGLADVRVGLMSTAGNRSGIVPDLVVLNSASSTPCASVGKEDAATLKTYGSIVARRAGPARVSYAPDPALLRRQVRQAVQQHLGGRDQAPVHRV